MTARIYKPPRGATTSGKARTHGWAFVHAPTVPRQIEPLMGWTASTDMMAQVRLQFPTKEEAIAYAERNGIEYRVEEPKPKREKTQAYSDNFRAGRTVPWTH